MYLKKIVLSYFFVVCAVHAFSQVPVLSSFAPANGRIGSKVVISGSNFSTVASSNIIFFGSVQGLVTTASATSITVVVPKGAAYEPISVTVNGNTAYSTIPFVVTQSIPPLISAASFNAHSDFPVANAPNFMALADFDNNGVTDISLTTNATNLYNFAAFRNKADCKNLSFATEQDFFSNNNGLEAGAVTADFDGDGRIDAAISEPASKRVTVFQNLSNSGTVSFQNGLALPSTTLPTGAVRVADMDGDGKPDIVVALFNSLAPTSGVAIYRNTSAGAGSFSFSAPQNISFLANPSGVALADLDADGKPEIIISDGAAAARVRRNKSSAGTLDNSSFENEVAFVTGTTPTDISTGDLDGDGKNDLAVSCASVISVLRFSGSAGVINAASFDTHVDFAVASTSVDLSDVNGDGKVDIAVNNGVNVSLFQNKASLGSITSGSFAARIDIPAGTATVGQVEVFDMNDDGYNDIVVTTNANLFSVLLYQAPMQPAPVITAVVPSSGLVNASIVISGSNFGTSNTSNAVYFGAVRATITSSSATQLTVKVPAYATFGAITVENLTDNLSTASSANFTPLFDHNKDFGGRIIPAAFGAKKDLEAGGSNAVAVALGDLDGDGFTDIISSAGSGDSLTVFRNKGNNNLNKAGFERFSIYFENDGNHAVFASDMDSDGKLDIVMVTRGAGDNDEVLIYHNESSPGSLSPASFGQPFQIHYGFLHINNGDAAIGDIDGDGKPELVCANSGVISVFKNNSLPGSFCFSPSFDIAAAGGAGVSLGDIDGDGKLDIASAGGYYGFTGFYLIRNTSNLSGLSFDTPVKFAAADGAFVNVEITDLDNDNKPDICWISNISSGQGLYVMKNTASSGSITTASLAAEITYPWNQFGTNPATRCSVADLNGDQKPDVFAGSGMVGVFENSSTTGVIDASSFHKGVSFEIPVNYSAQYPVAGDLDGDGKPEIVTTVSSYSTNIISVFHNETYPAPRIDALKNGATTTQSESIGTSLSTQGDFQSTNNDIPSVRFGSAVAAAGSSTNTSVVTKVPAGASTERVSVTLHGLTGFSPLPFTTKFPAKGVIDASTFNSAVDFPLITGATSGVAAADLDNDGIQDAILNDGGSIDVWRSNLAAGSNIASGMFSQLPQFGFGIGSLPLTLGDYDGDGFIDIHGNTSLWRNNSGTQATPVSFETGVQMLGGAPPANRAKTNIDFNRDGKTDLLFSQPTGAVYVLENLTRKGAFTSGQFSSFGASVNLPAAGTLGESTAGDFDGDGFDDIVYLTKSTNTLTAFVNNGLLREISLASFGSAQTTATLASPAYIFTADFNMDGKLDVAVGYSAVANISVFQNTSTTGSISFIKIDFPALANTTGMSAADLDGDGKPEIVTIHSNPNSFSVFKNTSNSVISLASKIDFALASGAVGLALADMNADGKNDILISRSPAILSIFQNQMLSGNTILIDTQPTDQNVCKGDAAIFTVAASGAPNLSYHWQFSVTLAGSYSDIADGNGYSNSKTAILTVNTANNFGLGFYRCRVDGDDAVEVISDSARLTAKDCNGGPPVIAAESLSTTPNGKIVIDLVPLITTSGNIDLSSIRIVTGPKSGATATITDGVLTIDYGQTPFLGKESIVIAACDDSGQCAQQIFSIEITDDIIIYNGVSANGDGKNDKFIIKNIELLNITKYNKVTIYDRWGDEVFSVTDYDNDTRVFTGLNNSGSKLPSGTYFYRIDLPQQNKSLTGFLSLKGDR